MYQCIKFGVHHWAKGAQDTEWSVEWSVSSLTHEFWTSRLIGVTYSLGYTSVLSLMSIKQSSQDIEQSVYSYV
jgi:hypothetical protein